MAHLFQWYYPEGGWGYVVLACACINQAVSVGFQIGAFGHPIADAVIRRFSSSASGSDWGEVTELQLGTYAVC